MSEDGAADHTPEALSGATIDRSKKMNKEDMIKWIDNASYADLLRKNRFAPIGDPMCCGEIGDHFVKVLNEKKNKLPHDEQVRISKMIGWGSAF